MYSSISKWIPVSAMLIVFLSCQKTMENPRSEEKSEKEKIVLEQTATTNSRASQISGTGFYAAVGECDNTTPPADYALRMTGDLQGCLYAFIDDYECSPSGTYREEGREYFVGTYKGQSGTFWTTYKFEAKYEGCNNGAPVGAEILGRCQHPITAGSGTGVFENVTGRLDFKDDIEAGNFPYRGHLRYPV